MKCMNKLTELGYNNNLKDLTSLKAEDDLLIKLKKFETENATILKEFDSQRAKMKELFLQKEEELKRQLEEKISLQEEIHRLQTDLDEAKSQLTVADLKVENDILVEKRKAQEEIATLEQLIQETVEESSCSRNQLGDELRKLQSAFRKLEAENALLRSQTTRESADGPQISLSTVTKTLARKVVSQLGADSLSLGPDNIEESLRKVNKYAQEDAEVLRSLVGSLEEEIKALKEKLRSTDDELQKHIEINSQKKFQTESGSAAEASCDMCANYEAQLVKMQAAEKEFEKRLADADHLLEVQKEDLVKEVEFRKEMEEKWNEKKEEHKIKVAELTSVSQSSQQALADLKQTLAQMHQGVTDELSRLIHGREELQRHLNALQKENENLVGKHSKNSMQLQSETINMPNNVEELHVTLLKMHEDLIAAKVAQEVAQEKEETLRYEVTLLQDQLDHDNRARQQSESTLVEEIRQLKVQVENYKHDHQALNEKEEKLNRLQQQLENTTTEKQKIELAVAELRQRLTSLQQELDTSEEVQKDFVRLSQSLQVQLEKIREAGSEVRWQHDEDVDECPNCRTGFTVTKRKMHCRHCGHIFCSTCLSHVVNSGPKQRPSRVCDVCHTLLVRDTAPYFSQEAPHLPEFRKEMKEKWNEKKEEHKIKVAELTSVSQSSQQALADLKQTLAQMHQGVTDELSRLIHGREELQRHLNALQKENENLVGKHSKNSMQLQSETINMPNNVEELHVTLLKMHEDLIAAKVAQEVAQEKEETLRYEVTLLQDQLDHDNRARQQSESTLVEEIRQLKVQVENYKHDHQALNEKEEKLNRLQQQLENTTTEKQKIELAVAELRQRLTSLQQELDTSEEVQKDFVRLSQSLQVQLEKIREAGSEVRWQHDEDVDECPNCRTGFTVTKRKMHCRHCGHIFCSTCLSHVVNSGPKQRPSRVCDVCHTLLVRDTAPYFSQEAPHLPE
ncbi:rab GTPase-binding effector protein 1-like [Neodiprion pinetum]|uniref:rab GTPase-binding effector protein 1-like n=1 Tax=Neodiprion pinetum TaxID=441929 RepID=UPI00372493AE